MKRIFALSLAAVCLLVSIALFCPASAATTYIRGDADGDGEVTIIDATVIQRNLANMPVERFDERAADITGDGVDITDVTLIQRYLAEFENIYHINEPVTVIDPTVAPTVPRPTRDPYELPIV